MLPLGTLVNAATVLVGGSIGLAVGSRLPQGLITVLFQGLGLSTLVLGLKMAMQFTQPLLVIFSLLLGGLAGASLGLEEKLAGLGDRLKTLVGSTNSRFTDGFLTAFLLYCIGSMAILGALEEGLKGDPTIYYTKAMLDGFASIALASTYGVGVLFSIIPLMIYQGGLTLAAGTMQGFLSPALITELSAVGGLLILGIGINLLNLTRIKLGDFLPSLLVIIVLHRVLA